MAGAVKPRLNRIAVATLCILGILPLFSQTAGAGRAWSKASPARTGQATSPGRPSAALPKGQTQQNLQSNESARMTRLTEIAKLLNDPGSDAATLTTEAARLCGFSIWKEDRTRISDPTGFPALHLAVTDIEIKDYAQMFRAGHSVVLGDLIGAMDVLFKKIGGQGSVGPDAMTWLQTGVNSENASVQALTAFLQDLGAFRPGAAFGNFAADTERLDPIQSLFILRVLTEDMAVPLRRALAKMKPGPPLAGPIGAADNRRLEHAAPDGAEDASASGLPASLDLPLTPCPEAPGYDEDAYAAGITGLFNKVAEGKKFIGKYADGVDNANAILTVVKFIATYAFLDGDIRVEAPGQPLVRTKNHDPGEKRTVVAHFFIDGTRVTDWMKDHRCLVALAGLDLDMPKTGDLKGVRTEWKFDQSPLVAQKLVQTPANTLIDLSKIRTDDKGKASVTIEGVPQPINLDPKKVMPVEKVVRITVTPQVKATEMKQDLVDAVTGAIGIEGGGVGFITPLLETLYRMNWTGEIHLDLRVRDWQQAETVGQLTIEIKAVGREFRKQYALQMSLDRSLVFIDTEMRVMGGEMPAALDPEVLKSFPAEQRALIQSQMEAYARQMTELTKTRDFYGTGPGTARMSFNDLKSLKTKTVETSSMTMESSGPVGTTTMERSDIEKWTASQEFKVSPAATTPYFAVKVDLQKKTASLTFAANIEVQRDLDSRTAFTTSEPGGGIIESGGKIPSKKMRMEIFDGLNILQALFPTGGAVVLPLKEEPVIDGGGAMNYYGSIPIPFTFGPNKQFKGTGLISYSVTRKVIKSK
jgi:hypothetical protein